MRKLATIQQINELVPIEGADRIVIAKIKGWEVIVGKDTHKIGDWVVFHEIDSAILKDVEPYAKDLDSRGTKLSELDDGTIVNAYVIKTLILRGVYSQGYIVPIKAYSKEIQNQLNNEKKIEQL